MEWASKFSLKFKISFYFLINNVSFSFLVIEHIQMELREIIVAFVIHQH